MVSITKIFLSYDLYFPVGLFFILNKIDIYDINNLNYHILVKIKL